MWRHELVVVQAQTAARFSDMVLILTADRGPAVSGPIWKSIVTTQAGKI